MREKLFPRLIVGDRHDLAIRLLTRKTPEVNEDLFPANSWDDKNIFNLPVCNTRLVAMRQEFKPQHAYFAASHLADSVFFRLVQC